MKTIQPTNSNVFFTLHDAHIKGLYELPPDHRFLQPYGKIVAVDPEIKSIVVGDRVIVNLHAAMKIPTELGDLFVSPVTAIYGKYVGDDISPVLNVDDLPGAN